MSYLDDFSNPQSGWATGDTGNTRRSYVDGEYEILVRNPGWWAGALCPAGKVVSYSVEADMRNDAGTGIHGLVFGWVDWDHFYLFAVSPDLQQYFIMRRDTTWVQLIPWTYSPAVLPYGAVNRLRVERQGAQITVYVNHDSCKLSWMAHIQARSRLVSTLKLTRRLRQLLASITSTLKNAVISAV